MKKFLSMFAILGIIAVGAQATQAAWYDSNWNPSNWFGRGCNKCEKKCDPCRKIEKKCDPCSTGFATPCNPCEKANPCPVQQPCDPCDKLQNMNK